MWCDDCVRAVTGFIIRLWSFIQPKHEGGEDLLDKMVRKQEKAACVCALGRVHGVYHAFVFTAATWPATPTWKL